MAHILIIDDDEQVRTTLKEMLLTDGYEVLQAANGKQGLRVFSEHTIDLVITDLLMPVMPGSRFISILRSDFPDLKIIAMSGGGKMYRPDSYLELANDLGAQAMLKKPFLKADLIDAVEEALASHI